MSYDSIPEWELAKKAESIPAREIDPLPATEPPTRTVIVIKDCGENPITLRMSAAWRIVDENGDDIILPWFFGRSGKGDAIKYCKHRGWVYRINND